ncbi:hypothetical protein [Kribbella sancticallisti]|uniref:hypothetical protein n=1 Tax=Kribbella sancticallisti TaxID=460087 RepID=UPI0031E00E1A
MSRQTFGAIDNHAWRCITKWIFHKYSRLSWQQLRGRFCLPGSWTLAHEGTRFTGASSVKVFRYGGNKIPTPWTPRPAAAIPGG